MTDTGHRPATKPDYTVLRFPEPPGDRPYVVVNMVSSADGKVVLEGSERGLGSPTDQRLMRELRLHADVVLNGSGTLRVSGTSSRLNDPALEERRLSNGKSRNPIAAVLTLSGDVPLEGRFFEGDDFEAVMYVGDGASQERRDAIEAAGRPVVVVPEREASAAMLRHAREQLGAALVVLEGGPTLNGDFLEHGLIDELFLTLGGLIVGGEDPITAVEQPGRRATRAGVQQLELVHALPNPAENEVYLRYRVVR